MFCTSTGNACHGTMQKITLKTVFKFLYDQLTGNFIGFLIGSSATGLVSHFFETRGLKNLWGLTAKKTVIDKATFQNLEWIIAIAIGFIVFEIVTKVIKARLEKNLPWIKHALFRWIIRENIREKARTRGTLLKEKAYQLFTVSQQRLKQLIIRIQTNNNQQ